ncbi:monovalent cation/H+ antiporter subunit D [Epibacterium sp. SM1979]|uniref:Monovalent cation/H+ antiporter subunit D n=1 Tax=Tritonibacter litoralis TaxID=2662264 RepID=A0A843YEX2_9RHOB|nr:monovalent cation/H+ antiporter subunit D [Tritonibacter litoralis]MQQ09990.1 monovalent cation/H+ antiporter subunit D [Tritonibacter litoralis]
MNHLLIAPVLMPAIVAPLIAMVTRHHMDLTRIFSLAVSVAVVIATLALGVQAMDGTVQVYELGDWNAPFGIVLVLDRLSAMMCILTAILALVINLYAVGSDWDKRGSNFHSLFQFQIMGIQGAFLTGDAFNLFVFFEVLLIASYGLTIHAGGARRFQAGVQYVVYNLLGSSLFLFALGTIYAVTGTLNMADLAVKVAEISPDNTALLRVGAIMLLLVFCIKAALLPLHFWLPASYAEAPAPVAALFAIMTKVGAYAILRFFTLIFGPDLAATQGLGGEWLLPAALVTLATGAVGVLGARDLGRLIAYGAIASMGTLLTAVALFTPQAAAAALYYTVHSTFAAALLFLVADMVIERRGAHITPKAPMAQNGLIAALFFVGAIALAGMPPISGFLGKLLVMDAARDHDMVWIIWAVILIGSLVTILGLARAGTIIFWKAYDATTKAPEADEQEEEAIHQPAPALPVVATFGLVAGLVLLTVFAGPMSAYATATAEQLFAPEAYIQNVLGVPK